MGMGGSFFLDTQKLQADLDALALAIVLLVVLTLAGITCLITAGVAALSYYLDYGQAGFTLAVFSAVNLLIVLVIVLYKRVVLLTNKLRRSRQSRVLD
jgi:hypothetical protein